MTMSKRTLYFLTLLVINLSKCYAENNPHYTYLIENIRDSEQILRGSGEELDEALTTPLLTSTRSEPTTTSKDDEDDYQHTTYNTTLDYEALEASTTNAPDQTEDTRKAEIVSPLEEIPKPESLKNETDQVANVGKVKEADDNLNETITTFALETEIRTEKITPATIDEKDSSIVYNTSLKRDIVANVSKGNNGISTTKDPQTTSLPPTPTEPIPAVSIVSDKDLDLEPTGMRNPKTENTETKPTIDKRIDEVHPRTNPVASKSSTLRSWLEDPFLRPPAGILVPLRQSALRRAMAVWNDLNLEPLNVTDVVIVGFDAVGINWRSRHSLQPPNADKTVGEALAKLLRKYQDVYEESYSDNAMKALASAAKLVPYDSSLFLITDAGAADAANLPLALKALVHKRLKVYTIWTDPSYPSEESELALQNLRNVSSQTEGEVLSYSLMDMDSNMNAQLVSDMRQWDKMDQLQPRAARLHSSKEDNYDTLLIRRVGGEALSLGIPVENGISALRVHIEGNVEHAILYPPNDAPQIDIYNMSSVRAFSMASKTEKLNPREVLLVFPDTVPNGDSLSVIPMAAPSSPLAGVWHLTARCDTCDYRLVMTADSRIHLTSEDVGKGMIRLRVVGPFSSVRESSLVDEFGNELAKLPFSSQPKAGDDQDTMTSISELQSDVLIPTNKEQKVYVKILGRNNLGEPFVRFTGPVTHQEIRLRRSADIAFPDSINSYNQVESFEEEAKVVNDRLRYNGSDVLSRDGSATQITNQQGQLLAAVQVGLGTKLYGFPGANLELHYEVTNYRDRSVSFNFIARGQFNSLTGIDVSSRTILAGQTITVKVSLRIATNAQPGARELIVFTAYTSLNEQMSVSSYVYTMNSGEVLYDVWAPELTHSFQGSCIGKLGDDCASSTWSTTVVARDAVSGLLRLTSTPVGLIYDGNFISGSRERVTAFYRSTCCTPRITVNAVDAFGNANNYTIDISNYLTGAAIAAIVLGVIFAIILIALIIFVIYRCVKRRKDAADIPSYTTSRSRNIN